MTHLFQFVLCTIFESSDVVHRQPVPLISPTEQLAVEDCENSLLLLKHKCRKLPIWCWGLRLTILRYCQKLRATNHPFYAGMQGNKGLISLATYIYHWTKCQNMLHAGLLINVATDKACYEIGNSIGTFGYSTLHYWHWLTHHCMTTRAQYWLTDTLGVWEEVSHFQWYDFSSRVTPRYYQLTSRW